MNPKGKSLTLQLVFNKTKSDNLNNIKNLNLWGNELQDLQLIQKMPNLEVISLSVNKISSLRDFAKCDKLHQLYLRKNCISDLREIKYLIDLPYLKSLWLYDNPCAQHENYRQIVLHHLPNLTKLDNNVVTQEEKNSACSNKYDLDFLAGAADKEQVKNSSVEVTKAPENNPSEVKRIRPYTQHQQERQERQEKQEKVNYQNNSWKPTSNKEINRPYEVSQDQLNRNKNILIAVLSLMKELDAGSLQIVRKQAEKELKSR